jgi:hypothetical protein
MTIREAYTLFNNIAVAHYQINDYMFCELDMIEENMNRDNGIKYPCLCVVPIQSTTGENVQTRRYHVMIMDIPQKDKANIVNVWSDTEQILNDIVKIFRNESKLYSLTEEPTLIPFEEQHSDWVAGHRCELSIETQFLSNYCDIPSGTFISPDASEFTYVYIYDQDGNTLATLKGGQSYNVTIVSAIDGGNATTIFTNSIIGN